MTVTPAAPPRKTREITLAYLGELLASAGFIDARQKLDIEHADRQFRAQSKSKTRAEDEASPYKALMSKIGRASCRERVCCKV